MSPAESHGTHMKAPTLHSMGIPHPTTLQQHNITIFLPPLAQQNRGTQGVWSSLVRFIVLSGQLKTSSRTNPWFHPDIPSEFVQGASEPQTGNVETCLVPAAKCVGLIFVRSRTRRNKVDTLKGFWSWCVLPSWWFLGHPQDSATCEIPKNEWSKQAHSLHVVPGTFCSATETQTKSIT